LLVSTQTDTFHYSLSGNSAELRNLLYSAASGISLTSDPTPLCTNYFVSFLNEWNCIIH
jgi:hypothetical protein